VRAALPSSHVRIHRHEEPHDPPGVISEKGDDLYHDVQAMNIFKVTTPKIAPNNKHLSMVTIIKLLNSTQCNLCSEF